MPDFLSVADLKKALQASPSFKGGDDLLKSLEGLAKSKDDPVQQMTVLKAVATKAGSLKGKAEKGDPLAKYFESVQKAAERSEKEAQQAASEVKKAAAERSEEVDFDALLVKQLMVVRGMDKDKAWAFVVALGKPSGLAISKAKITKEHREHARTWRQGKGKLIEGICYGEGGKYVFELEDKPAGGLAGMIKKAVKEQAKKDIKLIVRGGGQDLDGETDVEEMADLGVDIPAAPAGGPAGPRPKPAAAAVVLSPQAKEFVERYARLLAISKDARAAKMPDAEEAGLALSESQVFYRKKDIAKATELLDKAEDLLPPADAASAARAAAVQGASPELKQFAATLKRVLEAIPNAEVAGFAGVDQAKGIAGEAQALYREGKIGEARLALGRADMMLGPFTKVAKLRPEAQTPESKAFARKFAPMLKASEKAKETKAEGADEVALLLSQAQVAWRKGDYPGANDLLEKAGDRLGPLKPPPVARSDRNAKGPSQAAEAAWKKGRSAVLRRLTTIGSGVVRRKHPEAKAILIDIKEVMARFGEETPDAAESRDLMRYVLRGEVVEGLAEFNSSVRAPMLDAIRAVAKASV